MKISKEALAAALRHAGAVRPDRINIIPDGDGTITINAAEKGHGGVVTQSVIEAECDAGDAKFQVPYQHFRSVVESMPDGLLTIAAAANDAVTVRNGVTRLKTRAIFNPAVDLLSTDGASARRTLDGSALRAAIRQTAHAVPQKDLRPYLNTLRLEVAGGTAEAVATDGHRMMVSRFDARDAGDDVAVSILNTAVGLLSAMADAGDVEILMIGKAVVLARGLWLCRIPVIDGYPKWRKILKRPETTDPQYTVDAPTLLAAMRRMIIVGEDEAGQRRYGLGVRMSGDGENLRVELAGNESEDTVAVEAPAGAIDVGVDARLMADLLDAAGAGKVRITHVSANADTVAILVVPDDQRDPGTSRFASIVTEYRV